MVVLLQPETEPKLERKKQEAHKFSWITPYMYEKAQKEKKYKPWTIHQVNLSV